MPGIVPHDVVPRVLQYVGLLLLLTLASTFSWWAAAVLARAECRRVLHALACSMRWFFYSICLLVVLVVLRAVNLEPADPGSRLFSWIHLGGSLLISVPCAWRAFRVRGPRLAALVVMGWVGCAAAGSVAVALHEGLRSRVVLLPAYLARTP
ncbi:MAG: hypothetical protein ACE5JG_04560 [Planctomycetota bacterium]